MKMRIFVWIIAFFLAGGLFYQWYGAIPGMLAIQTYSSGNSSIETIDGKYVIYKSQAFLLYGIGSNPIITTSNIKFTDGIWLLRSIDPIGNVLFSGPNNITEGIKGRGTIFLDFQNDITLSIDALIEENNESNILPSFYVQSGKKMFYDLADIEKIIDTDLWNIYKNNVLKDEKSIYSGLSDTEIRNNINLLLEREPKKEDAGNTFFKKDVRIRTVLEDILSYMDNVKKQKKCGDSVDSCIRFIKNKIEEGKKLDADLFLGLEDPLTMWGKKNSSVEINTISWESIFQRYHLDTLQNSSKTNNSSAVNTRDSAIVTMIRSSQNPTYEMWYYLTYILSKEKNGSSYSLKIMTEMIRLGELLKDDPEHKKNIAEESNRALSNLRKVLEETYFDKKDDYLYVLKENLKDDKGKNIDTLVFVNDLNQLIGEIDKSTLFLEYPDFRILRRHLSWFTCIFLKNKEYLRDIRVCREEL